MCGRYVGESMPKGRLCDDCLQHLPRTEQAVLRQNSTEEVVGVHAASFLFFEKDHPLQRVIHRLKYGDQPQIGYELGRQAALEMLDTEFFEGIDVIIPMPLHPIRLRERGYNQAEYIARGLSAVTGIPVDTTHVTRVRNTPQQAKQTGDERRTNVKDAFAVNHPEQLYHKHILLVDDLITTGETMRSCLKAMRRHIRTQYSVFALCKAR